MLVQTTCMIIWSHCFENYQINSFCTCIIIWSHCFENYQINSFCTLEQRMLLIIHQGKYFNKILKLKTYIRKELPKCKITISTPVKQHDHGKASLTILHLTQKFKDLSISFVYNSNIGAFSLSSGGLHLNQKGLGILAINLKLKLYKLWYELESMNDDHDREILDENTSNFQGQRVSLMNFQP